MKPRRSVVAVVGLVVAALAIGGMVVWSPWVTAAPAAAATFSDVPASQANAVAIADLSGRGIIGGFADGTFKPDTPVTRQQFAKMIVKTLGLTVPASVVCPFTDVDPTPNATDPDYPAKYVAVCAQQGITTGKSPTIFDPGASITRQQLITMVVRATALPQPPASYSPPFTATQFTLAEHYANARAAAYAGLLGNLGADAAYSFSAAATRGDCAQVLHNLLFRQAKGQPVDLLHFWWDWSPNWKDFHVESVSTLVGGADGGAKVYGEPYYYFDVPNFPAEYIFSTGENGDLLVFAYSGVKNWKVEHVPVPGGSRIRGMAGGRAFNDVTAVTNNGQETFLHVFATDADDNLIHFWMPEHEQKWHSENVSAKTGLKMRTMGQAGAWEDFAIVQVVGTGASGDLVYFWMTGGGSWHAENVSQTLDQSIKGDVAYIADADGGLGTPFVAAGPNDEFLIFHHVKSNGPWSVENVTAATATAGQPGVTLGGWLSWWTWNHIPGFLQGKFHNPIAVLDTKGHFWMLERQTFSVWKTKDVSAEIGQTFRADTGGDSILAFWDTPGRDVNEMHLCGVNQDQHFIHFWHDGSGKWHAEDMSALSGQKVGYPVNYYMSAQQVPGHTAYLDQIAAISPDGDLLFMYEQPLLHDWTPFDVSTVTGLKVRAPELPWTDAHNHLVFAGVK